MATEIELKAHVKDIDALQSVLCVKAECVGTFEKEDTYWVSHLLAPDNPRQLPQLRVRREKRSLPGGSVVSATMATYKNKVMRDGIEVNDELEFEVSQGTEFESFLKNIGFQPDIISKQKRGWTFSHDEISAELVEVDGLGWFIELEIIVNGLGPETLEETLTDKREKLLTFLDELGLAREAIESRYYTEMLMEQKPKTG